MSQYFDGKELFLGPKIEEQGSHMVMTNVKKTTMKKMIGIDTRYCDDFIYQTACNNPTFAYTLTLPERTNNIKSIRVKSVELPMTYYNISSNLGNNIFKVTNNTTSTSTVITIPDAQYTFASLTSTINSLLSGLTISFNAGKCVFTSASNSFTIDFAVTTLGVFDSNNFRDKIGWMLGFKNSKYNVVSGSPVTSETISSLDGPKYAYLLLDEFTNSKLNGFSVYNGSNIIKNVICKIILDKTNYSVCLAANETNGLLVSTKRTYTNSIDMQRISVRLVDSKGVNLNLNGNDYSFTLEVEYE